MSFVIGSQSLRPGYNMVTIKLPAPVTDIYRAVANLEQLYPGRKFTPDGHLVGSIGEVIAAEYFGLPLDRTVIMGSRIEV